MTEAIALGHDVGHTPFGHVGERTLNLIMNGCETTIIIGFAIFGVIMLAFAVYEMRHAYEVDPNDETFLD